LGPLAFLAKWPWSMVNRARLLPSREPIALEVMRILVERLRRVDQLVEA
jgi:hypothetical protein